MIQKNRVWEQFEELSPSVQREVAELIARLSRDVQVPSASAEPREPLGDDGFIGIWRDREDMSDATEWVRRVRREQ